MGLIADQITLASMAAQSSNFTGPVLDLSGYKSGMLYCQTSVAGTTFTPAFQISLDGTNFFTIPTAVLATPAAVTATGLVVYPFLVPIAFSKFQVIATAFTGAFTANFVGIFNKT